MSNRIGDFPDSAMLAALLDALESAGLGCSVIIAHPDRLEMPYANEALARMCGTTVKTLEERHPFLLLPPEEREKLTKLRWAVRRGETEAPPTVSTLFVHEDGKIVPVEFGLGYALLGEQRATIAFVRNVTEKAAMEAALRESEQRFRRLAEASPDSIAIYVEGRCVYANPKAIEQLGLQDGADLSTFEPLRLVPPEHHEELVALGERVLRGEVVPPFVNRRTTPDGDVRTLEASLSSSTIDGQPAILVYTRDITERTRLQAEVLKQDRLASLGVLAAGVAHELNNPLAALSLLVQKLRADAKKRGPGSDQDVLEQVDDAVRRMTEIIGDLLFLARPAELPHAHVDLERVIGSTIALLRAGMPKGPPVIEDIDQLPTVRASPSKLGQVLLNVLRNAIEAASGVAGGKVHVRGQVVGSEVVITVEDTGVGIPEDVLPRLMTPFFTTKERGTGLGLWISQAIMSSHGGRLEIASTHGVGTTVTIALPR